MFLNIVSRIVATITTVALVCFSSVDACRTPPNAQYISHLPTCSSIPSISLDVVINPTLAYLRPTEVGLENPNLSLSPEYFAASAGAIAMTTTLNQLFQDLKTVHYGPNSLVGIPFPIVLNQTSGNPCVSFANLTVIPQYNLAITDIGTSNTYLAEGNQGIANNRESCELCNDASPPFAVIHGTLDNAGLYDVTSQVCNAFNVPTIAVSITDLTFQKLYPEAAAAARYSALASIGPTQVGTGLSQFMNQFGWQSVVVFLDPANTAQANEVIRGFQLTGLAISSQFVDYDGTGCVNAIVGVMDGTVSVIYIDLTITRVSECVRQILSERLLSSNYIVIWGPTLMASVNNSFQNLAGAVGAPLANFTGTFTLQVRTREASYFPTFKTNLQQLYSSWNDSFLYDSLSLYPTALNDNANAVILASQGIYGFLASKICTLIFQGLTLNLPDSSASFPALATAITSKFASVLSGSVLGGNYSVITQDPLTQQLWNVQLNTESLNIVPNSAFYFYTQTSGYWSEASNMAKWYHDGLGNSLTTFDVYNLQNPAPSFPIGSYFSGTYSWVYNSSSTIIWPNPSALWQYNSGFPGDTPPLSFLTLSCLTGYSCPSIIVPETPTYQGLTEIVSYSTNAVVSDDGTWEMEIQCSGGGGTLFYTASIESDNPDSLPAWSISLNQRTAQIRLDFNAALVDSNKWPGGSSTLLFSCFDKNNILNGTLHIVVDNNASQYTPSVASQWVFAILNFLGIACSFVGAGLTIFYRHHRPIYSSSVPFLLIAWMGFAIVFGSGLISILPVTGNDICQAKSWLFNYGFVLVMGSLLLKTFHIHKIFNNDKLIIYRISLWQFTLSLASMLAVVTTVMLVWQNDQGLNLHRSSAFQPYCVTGSWVPFHIIAGFELLLVLACLWLGYQIRRVHHDYNESKCIGFIVYNTAIWGVAWWVMSSQISISPSTMSLLTSLFIFVVCFLNGLIFFMPKFYAISVEYTNNRGLVVTPRQGSNKLAHSRESDEMNSTLGPAKAPPKALSRQSVAEGEFILPQDGKDALKFARDKLFETARKWKANDAEHARLKRKIGECEMLRVQDSELINSWMVIIRNVLTSGQVTPKDSEALMLQMWNILNMQGSELIAEAEKYESSRKKKEIVAAPSSGNVTRANMSMPEITSANLTSSATVGMPKSSAATATLEMVAMGSPSMMKSSVSLSEMNGNPGYANSITRKNHI